MVNVFIGKCADINSIREQLVQLTRNLVPILIYGESGSRKTLLARVFHDYYKKNANLPKAAPAYVLDNGDASCASKFAQRLYGKLRYTAHAPPSLEGGGIEAAVGGSMILENVDEYDDSALEMIQCILPKERQTPQYGIKVLATTKDIDSLPEQSKKTAHHW